VSVGDRVSSANETTGCRVVTYETTGCRPASLYLIGITTVDDRVSSAKDDRVSSAKDDRVSSAKDDRVSCRDI